MHAKFISVFNEDNIVLLFEAFRSRGSPDGIALFANIDAAFALDSFSTAIEPSFAAQNAGRVSNTATAEAFQTSKL